MKQLRINTKSCSYRDLCTLAKACGFVIREGGKHAKVRDGNGVAITTIPRHEKVDSYTAKEIVKKFIAQGCEIGYN